MAVAQESLPLEQNETQFLDRRMIHEVPIGDGSDAEPELRLMAMILEDAMACYMRFHDAKSATGRREFRAADTWLFGRERDWVFSFESICSYLGIASGSVRARLRQSQARGQTGKRRRVTWNEADPESLTAER